MHNVLSSAGRHSWLRQLLTALNTAEHVARGLLSDPSLEPEASAMLIRLAGIRSELEDLSGWGSGDFSPLPDWSTPGPWLDVKPLEAGPHHPQTPS
jgi:hypothetical protein